MKGTFQFLGTGGSAGIPMIGCNCPVCTSKDPKNQRLRPSGRIQIGGKHLLIDIGPDFRTQAIRFGIDHLDGLILTHTHYDHIAGIDELRIFNIRQEKPFPTLLSRESYDELKKRYYYFFQKNSQTVTTQLDCQILDEESGVIDFLGLSIRYYSFIQGGMKVTGFRLGDFAYISDIRDYDPSIFTFLSGVRNLVLSALKPEPSTFHLSFDEAISFAKKSGAEKTWLTHLGHFVDHDEANNSLPKGIKLGYDGQKIELLCTK